MSTVIPKKNPLSFEAQRVQGGDYITTEDYCPVEGSATHPRPVAEQEQVEPAEQEPDYPESSGLCKGQVQEPVAAGSA